MIVYSHSITPRLQYVLDFLSAYYGHPFLVTTSEQEYTAAEDIKINYTTQPLEGDPVWMEPMGLLFDKGVRPQAILVFDHDHDYKAFYKARGHVGFDLFAAVFYLLTRYEEYVANPKDAYGRFDYQYSKAYKGEFLHLPLINIWLEDFAKTLQLKTQNSKLKTQNFQPTYDIDIAWSYRNKPRWVRVGSIVKSLLKGEWRSVRERRRVLEGLAPDPYDSYAYMDSLHRQYGLQPLYFIHVGQKRNRYDKNIPTDNAEFRQLIQSIAAKYPVGLHPSWASNREPQLLDREKAVLEEIIGRPITCSRQHYIQWSLPQTFRNLVELGITDDYSMGYGSINGFRASIATPFYWYDIEREEQTALRLHPFAFMDANALFEQRQTPDQSLRELLFYHNEIKKVDGVLITIWHNTFLGTDPMFRGWKEMYEAFLKTASAGS